MVYHTSVEVSLYKHYNNLGDDPLILRGGGGGLALLVGTDYLFSSRDRPENYFRVYRGPNIYFKQQQIFETAKKKMKSSAIIVELVRLDV